MNRPMELFAFDELEHTELDAGCALLVTRRPGALTVILRQPILRYHSTALREITSRYHCALSLGMRACVLKST